MDGALSPGSSRHKFSVDDVLRMIASGVIPEKARVTLRAGELIDMPAEGPLHSNVKSELIARVAQAAAGLYRIGPDTPLRLADDEWPEPDLFVIPREIKPSEARGPDVLLLVEVADTSLNADLGENAQLYARFGVREYWVVDLVQSRIHVHALAADGTYPAPRIAPASETVEAAHAPGVTLRLADLL